MDKIRALELLREALSEIHSLKKQPYNNEDYPLWRSKINVILEDTFGENSKEYQTFSNTGKSAHMQSILILDFVHQEDYIANLKSLERCLKSIIQKHEILLEPSNLDKGTPSTVESPIQIFEAMRLHPKVVKASKSLFENKHYAQAIFEAFKAVENFVQDKSGISLYGSNLMEKVFNEENPVIKVPEAGYYYKDVQRGFKNLFIGAAQGIRNPKAHKEIIQKDPYITLQYLGFASFLLKRIDYWEVDIS